ncbi:MAG: hypothetical protein ABEK59_09260 [Halobacteria archaeon]
MSHALYHAHSSAKAFGGDPEDYLAVHEYIDQSRNYLYDPRHRMLMHHATGIQLCIQQFGSYITTSHGRKVPTQHIAEQHIKEDLGCVPTLQDWAELLQRKAWMSPRAKLLFRKALEEVDGSD